MAIEDIVRGAAADRAKLKEIQQKDFEMAQAERTKESEARRAEALRVMEDVGKCRAILDAAYLQSHDNMQARIETILDRCRSVAEELNRIYRRDEK